MFQVCHKNMSTIEEVFIIDGLEKPILSSDVLKVFKLILANFPFAEVNEVNNEPAPEQVQVFHGCGPELDDLMNMPKNAPWFNQGHEKRPFPHRHGTRCYPHQHGSVSKCPRSAPSGPQEGDRLTLGQWHH